MFILTKEEIKYCVGIKQSEGNKNTVLGLIYNNNFFIKAKHYDVSEYEDAIKDCRENYLDNQEVQLATLMIKEDNSVSIWTQDNSYQAQNIASPNATNIFTKTAKTSPGLNLEKLIEKMRGEKGLNIKTRHYKLKLYHHSFIGKEAVDWFTENLKISREAAVKLGQQLTKEKYIHHVKDEHNFEDSDLLYRFYEDEDKKIWTDKFI